MKMKFVVRDDSRKEEERVLYKPGPSFTVYRELDPGDGRVFVAVASEIDDAKTALLFSAAPDLLKASESILAAITTKIENIPGSNNEIGKACEYFAHVFSQRVENLRLAIAKTKGLI
jgi:hypothetical protein